MASASDDFNRSNENPLAGSWEVTLGSNLQISSNVVKGTSGVCVVGWKASVNNFGDVQFSQVRILTPGSGDVAGPALQAASGQCYLVYYNEGDSRIYLEKVGGPNEGPLTSSVETVVGGDIIKATLDAGGNIAIYVNDVEVNTFEDPTPLTGGQPGMIYDLQNSNATSLDDWAGGDGTGPGGGGGNANLLVGKFGALLKGKLS